ncbi:hypothetical protein FIV00_30265 [Labrenzia sp. THAF82]|nr:hypothetical protein FIV00_30265 [Labrenzia sp. THAF82]
MDGPSDMSNLPAMPNRHEACLASLAEGIEAGLSGLALRAIKGRAV